MDFDGMLASPAFRALRPSQQKVLSVITKACGSRNSAASITYAAFELDHGIDGKGLRQSLQTLTSLGLVDVEVGARLARVYRLSSRWRHLSADVVARISELQRRLPPPRSQRAARAASARA